LALVIALAGGALGVGALGVGAQSKPDTPQTPVGQKPDLPTQQLPPPQQPPRGQDAQGKPGAGGTSAAPMGLYTFSNPASIAIPASGTSGIASPYPSDITMLGVPSAEKVYNLTVTLYGLSHTFPADIDIL